MFDVLRWVHIFLSKTWHEVVDLEFPHDQSRGSQSLPKLSPDLPSSPRDSKSRPGKEHGWGQVKLTKMDGKLPARVTKIDGRVVNNYDI